MDKALKKRVALLFSGGLDSTVALAMAVKEYGNSNVEALSIYYGQKHDKEILAAKNVIKYYNVNHTTLDLSQVFAFGGSSLLKDNGNTLNTPIATGTYKQQMLDGGIISTYVPFRNGLMISAAASIALAKKCGIVVYGAHMDDAEAAYPDCTDGFFNAMRVALEEGSGGMVTLNAPFIQMRKCDIVALGLNLSVPFELTWSCYNGKDKPCGQCATCIDREKAFKRNGATDPLLIKD